MTISTLIDFNSVELNYYPFMISLDKCNGIFNAADDLSMKTCVPSETKDVNVKVLKKYLKSIANTSAIVCDEIIDAKGSVSTNVTNNIPTNRANTILTNVTRTVSIYSDKI